MAAAPGSITPNPIHPSLQGGGPSNGISQQPAIEQKISQLLQEQQILESSIRQLDAFSQHASTTGEAKAIVEQKRLVLSEIKDKLHYISLPGESTENFRSFIHEQLGEVKEAIKRLTEVQQALQEEESSKIEPERTSQKRHAPSASEQPEQTTTMTTTDEPITRATKRPKETFQSFFGHIVSAVFGRREKKPEESKFPFTSLPRELQQHILEIDDPQTRATVRKTTKNLAETAFMASRSTCQQSFEQTISWIRESFEEKLKAKLTPQEVCTRVKPFVDVLEKIIDQPIEEKREELREQLKRPSEELETIGLDDRMVIFEGIVQHLLSFKPKTNSNLLDQLLEEWPKQQEEIKSVIKDIRDLLAKVTVLEEQTHLISDATTMSELQKRTQELRALIVDLLSNAPFEVIPLLEKRADSSSDLNSAFSFPVLFDDAMYQAEGRRKLFPVSPDIIARERSQRLLGGPHFASKQRLERSVLALNRIRDMPTSPEFKAGIDELARAIASIHPFTFHPSLFDRLSDIKGRAYAKKAVLDALKSAQNYEAAKQWAKESKKKNS